MLYGENEYGNLSYADLSSMLLVLRSFAGIMAVYFATDKFDIFVSPVRNDEFLAAKKGVN